MTPIVNNQNIDLQFFIQLQNEYSSDKYKAYRLLTEYLAANVIPLLIKNRRVERSLKYFFPFTDKKANRFQMILERSLAKLVEVNFIELLGDSNKSIINPKNYLIQILINEFNRRFYDESGAKRTSKPNTKSKAKNKSFSENDFSYNRIQSMPEFNLENDSDYNGSVSEKDAIDIDNDNNEDNNNDVISYNTSLLSKVTKGDQYVEILNWRKHLDEEYDSRFFVIIGKYVDEIIDQYFINTSQIDKEILFKALYLLRNHASPIHNTSIEIKKRKKKEYIPWNMLESDLLIILDSLSRTNKIVCDYELLKEQLSKNYKPRSIHTHLKNTILSLLILIKDTCIKYELYDYLHNESFAKAFHNKFNSIFLKKLLDYFQK